MVDHAIAIATGARVGRSMTVSDLDTRPPAGTTPPPHRRRSWWIVGAAFIVAVALTAVIAAHWSSDDSSAAPSSDSTVDPATKTAIDDAVTKALAANGLSVAEIYQRTAPSLVEIDVGKRDGTGTATTVAGDDGSGLGTGLVVNQDGSIITANHVVDGATSIQVLFSDGTKSTATVASSDPVQDIAVLTPQTLPSIVVPAVLGGGGAIGDPVVAIGNPLGLDGTTTSGVISGLNRSITGRDGKQRTNLIQFDAAVNPGSSGGPLLNAKGETIGIVVALANPSDNGYFIGIGFAVPIGTAVGGGGGGNEPPK
jgi:S1-C subfamily serine protease